MDPLVLTPRQEQVLGLLATGLTAQEIGSALGISSRTARAHIELLKEKLGVRRSRDIPMAYRRTTGIDAVELALGRS